MDSIRRQRKSQDDEFVPSPTFFAYRLRTIEQRYTTFALIKCTIFQNRPRHFVEQIRYLLGNW